jgi:hypothetical protein
MRKNLSTQPINRSLSVAREAQGTGSRAPVRARTTGAICCSIWSDAGSTCRRGLLVMVFKLLEGARKKSLGVEPVPKLLLGVTFSDGIEGRAGHGGGYGLSRLGRQERVSGVYTGKPTRAFWFAIVWQLADLVLGTALVLQAQPWVRPPEALARPHSRLPKSSSL